jgi:hypothetical protein
MKFGLTSLFGSQNKIGSTNSFSDIEFSQLKQETGLSIRYSETPDAVTVSLLDEHTPTKNVTEVKFPVTARDEARILYTQSSELLRSRAAANNARETIQQAIEGLFSSYRRP